jgi:hypothetical protein
MLPIVQGSIGLARGYDQSHLAIAHHDVFALPDDPPTQRFKNPDRILMANPRQLGHIKR